MQIGSNGERLLKSEGCLLLERRGENARWRNYEFCTLLFQRCVFTSVLTGSHLHVSSQGADPPLASSAGQEDGDDGQQGADGQQSTASGAEHRAGLEEDKCNLSLLRVEPAPLSLTGSNFFICGSHIRITISENVMVQQHPSNIN